MKEVKKEFALSTAEGLTNLPQTPYPKGGDNFMPQEGGETMLPKPQPANLEHSEGIYGGQAKTISSEGQRAADIITLEKNKNLSVEVRRALEDVKQQSDSSQDASKEVIKNASLGDSERLNSAIQLLKRDLTEREKEALLKAHNLGKEEAGKNNDKAGVYNYTKSQLLGKARILKEAGFNEGERRTLMEAGLVGAPVDNTGINDPKIIAEMDTMNNLLDVEVQPSLNTLYEALNNISRLSGVNPAEKKIVIERIKERLTKEKETVEKMQVKAQEKQDMTYRFSFSLMKEEMEALMKEPTRWLNGQFDQVYALAEEGQELNSPLIQNTQNKIAYAIDLIKASNPEHLKSFMAESTVRLHLLQMRTAIGYKDMDQVKGAAGQLRAHGLLLGMQLEQGRVGAMFNRFQDLLEESRLWSNTRHHVMLEDALKVQKLLIDEQVELAKKGVGNFRSLKDIANNPDALNDFALATDEKMTDLYIEKAEKETGEAIQAKGATEEQKAVGKETLAKLERIKRIQSVNADITRAVRTAYDVFVSSQRMGVVTSRGKYLLKGQSRYRSDPIGPLNVYNMEDLTINRFDMYSPEQEEFVNRIKLDMAESYLKNQKKIQGGNQKELAREEKIDLGARLFRDIFAVPDFFSSGWRIEGVIQALEQRFETSTLQIGKTPEQLFNKKELVEYNSKKTDKEKKRMLAEKYAEDFALFMRLRYSGQEQLSSTVDKESIDKTRKNREEIWEKIRNYRPEEIIRLFRERKNSGMSNLYKEMYAIDPELKLNVEEELANRPDDEGGRGRDLTVYDKFKLKYGAAIGLLRQEGFNKIDKDGVPIPEQINLAKLGEEPELGKKQRDIINKFLEDAEAADKLIKLAKTMQAYIEENKLVDDLLTKNEFADIYTRSIIIDDALLDKLENEKPDVVDKLGVSRLGYVPFSKLIGEAAAGNDTLTRSWNDTGNAIEGGNTLIKFIKEENLEKKTEEALKFASLAASYNGLGSKGQSECVRYTIGTYLGLSKIDKAWDIIGIRSLPFRIPASEAQRIFGVQAAALGRDDLRGNLDHLRGFLNSSLTKARETLQEKKREIVKKGLSDKNKEDIRGKIPDYKEKAKEMNLSEDEYLRNKFIEELELKFKIDELDSRRFYKDMENLLEVTRKDFVKRAAFRFLFYLMLAVIGETVNMGKSVLKESSGS